MCWLLLCCSLLLGQWVRAGQVLDEHDAVVAARCVAHCWTPDKPTNESCALKCLGESWSKPGSCPARDQLTDFETACINVCSRDAECPGTTRCCPNECGVTCQAATGLEHVTGVPPIPGNISLTERRRSRTVLVEWAVGPQQQVEPGPTVVYVVEERHHLGHQYVPSRLTPWAFKHRSLKPKVAFKFNVVRPGRWYQFRVAAANERGSLGFSVPSDPFTLSIMPKPPREPQKLTVSSVRRVNGTLWGELTWEPPASSDVPIQRYKVYWSQHLQSNPSAGMSAFVKYQMVPKDTTRFTLKYLEPDSLYFLQVQAISHFGLERLKSEKASMVFNSTNYKSLPEESPRSLEGGAKRSADRIVNLRVQKMFWTDNRLVARISWLSLYPRTAHYTITWWSRSCQGDSKRVQMAATTESSSFDLHALSFRCKYRVTVKPHGAKESARQHEALLVMATPSCVELASSIPQQEKKPSCPSDKHT